MQDFEPLIRNPHWQTIASHFWPRRLDERRFPVARRRFCPEPGIEVLVESQQPDGPAAGDIIMVPGLEGSGQSGYMRSLAAAALRAGLAAHRFHFRSIYNAGLTGDLLHILRQFRAEGRPPSFLVGFSLGGNVVVKLAGELGDTAADLVQGVCGVSAALDLAACARRISQRDNRIYERRFVRRLRARARASGKWAPHDLAGLRSIVDFDDRITAPYFGFGDAANYYRTQSAACVLGSLCVPVLLIQAKDDTFVPFEVFETEAVRANPWIELMAPDHGGHLGFLGKHGASGSNFWADEMIVQWIRGRQMAAPVRITA